MLPELHTFISTIHMLEIIAGSFHSILSTHDIPGNIIIDTAMHQVLKATKYTGVYIAVIMYNACFST